MKLPQLKIYTQLLEPKALNPVGRTWLVRGRGGCSELRGLDWFRK